jgi:glucose-6-phosphate 1-dehydrogenase
VIDPATIVIFGGAGDLAGRKLLPALYNLHVDGLLPEPIAIVAAGRRDFTDDSYRAFATESVERFSRRAVNEVKWKSFARTLFFVNIDIAEPGAFATLGARLDTIEHERGLPRNRVYYLAVPPSMFAPTVKELARARFVGRSQSRPYARLIVEKPVGLDLDSARQINDAIASVFDERQIFRIDHYLGKETVQNILVLRFANSFFEPLFNQKYIDHVQITVAEDEGVGTRAGYYEQAGALRDIVQNHLLQLLALIAMEPPYSLDADVVRDEKLEVIQALRPLDNDAVDRYVVRGQYAAGIVNGKPVIAYTDEPGVDPRSRTETFVALEVFIENWRWSGVPFFLRTGKRLPKRASEILIHLKGVPEILFNRNPQNHLEQNILAIRIQPNEGFSLRISSKVPGAGVKITPVEMDFDYCSAFHATSPEAYERLLLDVLAGDATLYMRRDAVETAWQWVTPILERWKSDMRPVPTYPGGEWGPAEADRLIESTGRRWRPI